MSYVIILIMSRGKPKYTCPLNFRVEEEVFVKLVNDSVILKKKSVSEYAREIIKEKVLPTKVDKVMKK